MIHPVSDRDQAAMLWRWLHLRKGRIGQVFLGLVIACVLAGSLQAFVIKPYVIPSGSMKNTLLVVDRVLVNRLCYGLRIPWTRTWLIGPKTPKRNEVIVFDSPESNETYTKRVISIRGDTLEIIDLPES